MTSEPSPTCSTRRPNRRQKLPKKRILKVGGASDSSITDERRAIIEEKLQAWCDGNGFKDTAVNMLTLSNSIGISKSELTQYFTQCQGTIFRIWLANIRFEAAKAMMHQFPPPL